MAWITVVPSAAALGGVSSSNTNFENSTSGCAISPGQRARWTLGGMTGRSSAMERLFLQMRYLANHLRVALIEGERGTGKLMTAQTLHALGANKGGCFVECPATRFFSEGASAARLEEACGGTLYLSNIDALNHAQQGQLLHLLGWMRQQQGRGNVLHPGPVRPGPVRPGPVMLDSPLAAPRALLVSCARPLRSLVLQGKFRSDLHQQLSAVELLLPPLRERRQDIAMLVELMLAKFSKQYGKSMRGLADDVLPFLLTHSWLGNVRELETVITRAALRAEQAWLQRKDVQIDMLLPAETPTRTSSARLPTVAAWPTARLSSHAIFQHSPQGVVQTASQNNSAKPPRTESLGDAGIGSSSTLDPNLDRAILRHIHRVLHSVNGNKLQAARLLGISRSTLYRLLDAKPLEMAAHNQTGELPQA